VSSLEPLKGLTALQRLDLSNTKVSSLEPLKGLTALQWLDLSNTKVSSVEAVYDLPKLMEQGIKGISNDLRALFVAYRKKKGLPY